jgi:hypothetical protein
MDDKPEVDTQNAVPKKDRGSFMAVGLVRG